MCRTEDHALAGRCHAHRLIGACDVEGVEGIVVVPRVVMEPDEVANACLDREHDRLTDGAVPPADVMLVLVVGVLGVMDEDVGAVGKVEARCPHGRWGTVGRRAPARDR